MTEQNTTKDAPFKFTLFETDQPTRILVSRERVNINLSVGGIFLLLCIGCAVEEAAGTVIKLISGAR